MREATDQTPEVVNMARLQESTGGDQEFLRELVTLYVKHWEDEWPQIEQAAEARDMVLLGQLAHALKGASLCMGADEAANAFKRLEDMGKSADAEGVEDAVEAARNAYRRACDRMNELAA